MLVLWQQDLAERLASLKGHDGEDNPALKARMRDLEQEQRQIRDALASFSTTSRSTSTSCPTSPKLKKLRRDGAEVRQGRARQRGVGGDGRGRGGSGRVSPAPAAMKRPRRPPTSSTSSSSKCNGMGNCAGNGSEVSAGPVQLDGQHASPNCWPAWAWAAAAAAAAWAAYGIGRPLRRAARHVRKRWASCGDGPSSRNRPRTCGGRPHGENPDEAQRRRNVRPRRGRRRQRGHRARPLSPPGRENTSSASTEETGESGH